MMRRSDFCPWFYTALLLTALPAVALAQTAVSRYVSPTGNDANTGQTLTTPWRTIQKACSSAPVGSTVYIRGGTYLEQPVVSVSGTASQPITFRNYATEAVYLDGTGATGGTMLTIANRSYLAFQGFTIRNLTRNDAQGIAVTCTATGTSKNLTFRDLTITGIRWTTNAAAIPNANQNAQGMVVYGAGSTAARAITNLTIDRCQIYGNVLGFSEALSLDGNISGFAITRNTVRNNTNIGILVAGNYRVCAVATLDHARNGVVTDNVCYANVSSYATSGGIYVDGGQNTVIERNRCYDNGFGIELGCEENGTTSGITVRNNLIYHNREAGMAIGGYTTATTGQVTGCTVRNNSFFQNDYALSGNGELYLTKVSTTTITNNAFYTNAQGTLLAAEAISPQTGNVLSYNRWYTPNNNANDVDITWRTASYSSFSAYRTATGQDVGSTYGTPGFTRAVLPTPDLRPLTTSACRDAGKPGLLPATGETDFAAAARLAGLRLDVGAYELPAAALLAVRDFDRDSDRDFDRDLGRPAPGTWYPNPTTSRITWAAPDALPANAQLTAWAADGRAWPVRLTTGTGQLPEADLTALPAGVYQLRIRTRDGRASSTRLRKE